MPASEKNSVDAKEVATEAVKGPKFTKDNTSPTESEEACAAAKAVIDRILSGDFDDIEDEEEVQDVKQPNMKESGSSS